MSDDKLRIETNKNLGIDTQAADHAASTEKLRASLWSIDKWLDDNGKPFKIKIYGSGRGLPDLSRRRHPTFKERLWDGIKNIWEKM